MKFYLAPMEGVTTYVMRQAYHNTFQPLDKYFTPFLVPYTQKKMSSAEWAELNPEHNHGLHVVPQILTNQAKDFVQLASVMHAYGYQEVNLNLGCPSKTVVSKGRGSGFLEDPMKLDRFFGELFTLIDPSIEVSVKTRIGMDRPLEFEDLMKIYNKYPISELTIHPRLQSDYYKNTPNWDVFQEALDASAHKICYNGDIFTKEDYDRFRARFPQVEAVMLGRGIIAHPELRTWLESEKDCSFDYKKLRKYHDEVFAGYAQIMSGDKNLLYRMKEFWSYFHKNFPEDAKLWKKIKKCERLPVYHALVEEVFAKCTY